MAGIRKVRIENPMKPVLLAARVQTTLTPGQLGEAFERFLEGLSKVRTDCFGVYPEAEAGNLSIPFVRVLRGE